MRPGGVVAILAAIILLPLPLRAAAATALIDFDKTCRDSGGVPSGRTGSAACAFADSPSAPPAQNPASQQVGSALGGLIGGALGRGLVHDPAPPYRGMRRVKVIAEDEGVEDSNVGEGLESAQDIIAGYGAPKTSSRPPPATKKQVLSTITELNPFPAFDRTAKDRLIPAYKACESGCGCLDADGDPQCTLTCSGTCYAYGQKDPSPEGEGIDCSGLIAQENPEFWSKADRFGPDNCVLGKPNDCRFGTQQQLSLLKDEDMDDIDHVEDLKAGDVAFFNGRDKEGNPTRVKHVMQLTTTPTCGDDGGGHQACTVFVIQAPHSGVPVSRNELTLVDGHVVKKDGLVVDSDLYMYSGGTPPAGKRTGGEEQ